MTQQNNQAILEEKLRALAEAIKQSAQVNEVEIAELDGLIEPTNDDKRVVLGLNGIQVEECSSRPSYIASLSIAMEVWAPSDDRAIGESTAEAYSVALSSIDPQNPASICSQLKTQACSLESAKVIRLGRSSGYRVEIVAKLNLGSASLYMGAGVAV